MGRLFCKNFLGNFGDLFGVVSGFIADLVRGDVTMVTGSNLLAGRLEVRVALVLTGPCLLWRSGIWFWACVEAGVLQMCGTVCRRVQGWLDVSARLPHRDVFGCRRTEL